MEEYKVPQEEPEYQEEPEEYSFLQEVIKDETGGVKNLKRKIFRMMGFGFVFGIIACITFCAFKPVLEKHFSSDPSKITIPKDEIPDGEALKPEGDTVAEPENYSQMIQNLNETAVEDKRSLVELEFIAPGSTGEKMDPNMRQRISGVIIADNGQELLILGLTSELKETESIQAVFQSGAVYQATEKMKDTNLGISVYAVKRADIENETWSRISPAILGSSYSVSVGDAVILLGKPFGQEDAAGFGVVAACDNHVELSDGWYDVISVDAAGFTGGSGIIVNTEGEVLGIIAPAVWRNQEDGLIHGYGISDIKEIAELLSNGAGVPYIGVHGTNVTEDMGNTHGIPQGVYVSEVEADSPAMAAGIQCGDVITHMEETEVNGIEVYHNILMNQKVGNVITIKGKRQSVKDEYVDIDFEVTIATKK